MPRKTVAMAVINPLSGERSAALAVLVGLRNVIVAENVVELSADIFRDPKDLIEKISELRKASFEVYPGVRPTVIVAGGDGTVNFVFGLIAKSTSLAKGTLEPAIAPLPLGTGNDFSATLGFGQGFTENQFCAGCFCLPNSVDHLVNQACAARCIPFDRWSVTIEEEVAHGEKEGQRLLIDETHFMNYFSIGMDARVSYHFDQLRKKFPKAFRYRTMNKLWYGICGLAGYSQSSQLGNSGISMTINGKDVPISSKGAMALVVSNVTSYAGGASLWKAEKSHLSSTVNDSSERHTVEVFDGKLEVTAITGFTQMALLQAGGHGSKLGVGSKIEIRLPRQVAKKGATLGCDPCHHPFQIDGEPLGSYNGRTLDDGNHLIVSIHQIPEPSYVRCMNKKFLGVAEKGVNQ